MKIAVLSESTADEAAIAVLVGGLAGTTIERVAFPEPSTRGWRGVLKSVEPVLRYVHYRTDAEALVVAVDSDESPIHRMQRDAGAPCAEKCRLCELRRIVDSVRARLRPRQGSGPIRVALGLAVPAIEAWCLCGTDHRITESAWCQAIPSRKFPFTKKELKKRLYATAEPPLELETRVLVENAERIVVAEKKLTLLEKCFPTGFGSLAAEIRGWR